MGEGMREYVFPGSVEEAVAELEARGGKGRVIAGGTDVLPDLREGRMETGCLIDVTRIPGLDAVVVDERWVMVGAGVTFAGLRLDGFLQENVPGLVEAAGSVGAGAIQNAATWVGNIVQAMPAADGGIAALALGAEARIVGADGVRWERVEHLFAGPGVSRVDPTRELVTHLRFPTPTERTGTAWRRVVRRAALVLPILNCAVRVELEGTSEGGGGEDDVWRIADAAIAIGPVAPRPLRAREAEVFLVGRMAEEPVLREAAVIARGEAHPRTSVMRASREYRLAILPELVMGALTTAVERAGG